MNDVQRIEIVIDAGNSARVLSLLTKSGLQGYSVIRGVSGSGEADNARSPSPLPLRVLDRLGAPVVSMIDHVGGFAHQHRPVADELVATLRACVERRAGDRHDFAPRFAHGFQRHADEIRKAWVNRWSNGRSKGWVA